MNWFRRHLNWTALFGLLGGWAIGCMAAFVVANTMTFLDPYVSEGAIVAPATVTATVVGLAVFAATWGWVLRRKKRSLWWLLLAIFVPLGWIAIFVLENRSR